jgi:hypothetical protein
MHVSEKLVKSPEPCIEVGLASIDEDHTYETKPDKETPREVWNPARCTIRIK